MANELPIEMQNSISASIALAAIRALVVSHPDPIGVRRAFDRLYAEVQIGVALTPLPYPDERREFTESMVRSIFDL